MSVWRSDPALAARFHPEYPDDLEVLVHDGEPRRTEKRPERCWVRVTALHGRLKLPAAAREQEPPFTADRVEWPEHAVYRGTLLNQPFHLTTMVADQSLLFMVVPGIPNPLRVTEAYLAERASWVVTACDRCGADQGMDPPTTMWRTRFPEQTDVKAVAFTAFCHCGGTMMLSALEEVE